MPFGDEIKTGNITENWLFKLANDNSGFLYFAFSDVTDSGNFYHGIILNKPSIRESIDLSNSTSKTSNVSISMHDFTYQGNPISEELFGGSNHYINQTVSVYSKVGSATTQIGSFRLTDISSDGGEIKLSMASHRPWDFISIPQVKHDKFHIYEPLVYGQFIEAPFATIAGDVDSVRGTVHPVPVLYMTKDKIWTLMPRSYTTSDGSFLHYHVGFNQFVAIRDVTATPKVVEITTATLDGSGLNLLGTPTSNRAEGYIRTAPSDKDITTVTLLDDPENMYDYQVDNSYDSSTFASSAVTSTSAIRYAIFQTPIKNFHIDSVWKVKMRIKADPTDKTLNNNQLYDVHFYSNQFDTVGDNLIIGGVSNVAIGAGFGEYTFTFDDTPANTIGGQTAAMTPDEILLKLVPQASQFESHTIQVSDLKILYIADFDQELEDIETLGKIKYLYSGGNGLAKSGWESSGEIIEIHDAHLDMLIRFADLKQSDGTAITTPTTDSEVDGFNSLNTDRAGWKIRWWQLEPTELKKALEKLQYEGCFIFRYKADGSPQYIHIKDSHTADETLTKADISSVSVQPSPFSDLLTKIDVNYQKHPAENKYMTSQTSTNATARTNWNIQTKENIKKVDLDAYVSPTIPATPSTNPNDDFYTYYDNIFGDIKLIVSGTIVNPKYYNLEVGKVLAFTDMYPIKAFNTSWSGLKFMITGLTRTAGTLKFEAREI